MKKLLTTLFICLSVISCTTSKYSVVIDFQNIKDEIKDNINNGGCGVFAYYMHNRLGELGIQNSIYVAVQDSIKGNIDTAVLSIQAKWTHFVVKPESFKYFIDANGFSSDSVVLKNSEAHILYQISDKTLEAMLSKNVWNKKFEQTKIPMLIFSINKNVVKNKL
jgi:hypothetical protein